MKKNQIFTNFIKIILSLMMVFSFSSLSTVNAASLYNISYDVTYGQTSARTMLSLINDLREDVGSDELYYDYSLEEAAMQRAAEIAIYFSHTRPNEETCFTVLDDYSISYRTGGENIASGYTSVSSVFAGWSASSGHYANMVSTNYNAIGIGCCTYNNKTYWVQLFTYSTSLNTTATTANDSSTTVNVEVSTDIFETACNVIGHSYGDWELTTKATLSTDGVLTKTCSVCGATKTSTINSVSTISLNTTSYIYDGNEKEPTVEVIDSNGSVLTAGTDYTVSYSDNINAGTATCTVTGIGNYSFTYTIDFTILSDYVDISDATVTLSSSSYTYEGSAKQPTPTVKVNGTTLTGGTDYTVSYSNNTNAGTATVKIKGTGNYTGSVSKTFTISRRSISKATAKSISNKTYTGSAIKPSVTLTYNGTTLTKGTDYTVKYSSNKSTGKATITITGTGTNFTGTKKVYFYIVPKKVTISSVKSTKTKTLTVKYKKATGASGYQIAYRKKGTSTWKYKTVSSSSLSKKITGLKKKTNYQVKVRAYKTVSSKKYYGSWSKVKTVKTK